MRRCVWLSLVCGTVLSVEFVLCLYLCIVCCFFFFFYKQKHNLLRLFGEEPNFAGFCPLMVRADFDADWRIQNQDAKLFDYSTIVWSFQRKSGFWFSIFGPKIEAVTKSKIIFFALKRPWPERPQKTSRATLGTYFGRPNPQRTRILRICLILVVCTK